MQELVRNQSEEMLPIEVYVTRVALEGIVEKDRHFFLHPATNVMVPVDSENGYGISKEVFEEKGLFQAVFEREHRPVGIPFLQTWLAELAAEKAHLHQMAESLQAEIATNQQWIDLVGRYQSPSSSKPPSSP